MYKCEECGETFDELAEWNEDRGEFWGGRCYERMTGCPYCYGGAVEITGDEEREEKEE